MRISVDLDVLRQVVDHIHAIADSPAKMDDDDLLHLCAAMALADSLLGGTNAEMLCVCEHAAKPELPCICGAQKGKGRAAG